MIRFLSNDSWSFCIDFCDVIWDALYEYLVSFLGSIDARTWRGYRLGYTGPGWAPLTISVWWRGRVVCLRLKGNLVQFMFCFLNSMMPKCIPIHQPLLDHCSHAVVLKMTAAMHRHKQRHTQSSYTSIFLLPRILHIMISAHSLCTVK